MLLVPEQIELLSWLSKQTEPLSLWQMGKKKAPSFARPRVKSMYKEGLLDRDFRVNSEGKTYGIYSISDKGKAALLAAQKADEALREKARELADQKREKKAEHRFQLINTILGAVVGVLFTLLVEHWSDLAAWFSGIS